MRKLLGWTALALGVPALTWWANGDQAERIEQKVTANTETELANIADIADLTRDLNVTVEGRDVRIKGHVLESAAEEAEDVIEDQLSEAGGRRIVDVELTPHPSFGPQFTAEYGLGSGLTLNGYSTSDMPADGIAKLLGFDASKGDLEATGKIETTAYGTFGSAESKLLALAPILYNMPGEYVDTAKITVDGEDVSIDAEVPDFINKDEFENKLKLALGENANVTVRDLSAENGAVRVNYTTSEREVFSGGFWLPSAEFDVNVDNCQGATDNVLANYQIQFVTGSAELDAESREGINRISGILIACLNDENLALEIAGHTDNVGDPISNLKLSNARAKSVVDAIAVRGIKSENIVSKGYGDTKPLASNATAEGQEQNRRTEIVWSKK